MFKPLRVQSFLALAIALSVILTFAGCSGGGGGNTTPTQQQAATPTFSVAAGTYSAPQTVSISDSTPGAVIHYTTDGSTPTASSSTYSSALTISTTTTVQAIAVASSYTNSAIASATYTISQPQTAAPTISPVAGTYSAPLTVTIADSTSGATIHYTTDGTTPTASSPTYSGAFTISASATVQAMATASGDKDSTVTSVAYTISQPQVTAPTISPVAGTYSAPLTVTIADSTSGATIHYTTDGTTPTASSPTYSSAITLSASATVQAIATLSGDKDSTVTSVAYTVLSGSAIPVAVTVTSSDSVYKLSSQPALAFVSGTASTSTPTITVDESQTYQTVEGFGASMTDSAAYLLNEVAPTSVRDTAMQNLFTRSGNGIGLSFLRNPMGASDIARTMYSFDDTSSNTPDPTLANFSIAHDQLDVLPLTLQAHQLNPSLKIMANPWSPPAWMKTNNSMLGVVGSGSNGQLNGSYDTAFAQYFVKYIQAYTAAGVPIDYISLQNEPLYAPSDYAGMYMPAIMQLPVLRDYMLPALTAAGLSTRVLIYDHNWDTPTYPQTVLADSTVATSSQVAGIAWHGYGGTAGAMTALHNQYPNLGQYLTEHSGGTWVSNQGQADFEEITHVLRNWGKAYVKWSLALNESRGPHYGGCGTCSAPITVNSTTGAVTYNIEYYTLGQYSKFILPGATRVYSSNASGFVSAAFVNPDGTKALVVFNDTASGAPFQVQWGDQLLSYSLPAYAAATFTWSGTQSTAAPLNAKSQIQASSYSSVINLESEGTSDTGAGYDLGYSVSGSTAVYKNVDFGTGVTGLSARLACNASQGTCGGTAEFHLDSATGTTLGTVTIPSTGGWQVWQTAAGTVSGSTTGVHDLYVVLKATNSGSNSVANLNWFQFK